MQGCAMEVGICRTFGRLWKSLGQKAAGHQFLRIFPRLLLMMDPPTAHVLIDVRDEASTTLVDMSYLETIGFRVTNRSQLPTGHHAVVVLEPNVVVLEFPSTPEAWTAVREIRVARRMADVGIVVLCPGSTDRQHQDAHAAGADVFLPIRGPGLEWTARGVCAALASRGRTAAVLGFDRRVRLGARLCEGIRTREARILLFDGPDLPLLWLLLRAGYATTPTDVTTVRKAVQGTQKPDLIIVDGDAQPEAVRFMVDNMQACPPILCVTESPTASRIQLAVNSKGGVRHLGKTVDARQLIAMVERLAPDGDEGPDPSGPEVVSKRAPIPYRSCHVG
jgi:hypothetical protein